MQVQSYFSYIRVSTTKQGQTSTSLVEQRAAIERHAHRWNLVIIKEYEEQETAAKRGRPVFAEMLKALKKGKALGIIMHKIDRSARNLKDWADLGELIDKGIEVHFANESLDLHSRGGRLSADIQAVVAADYIRNLREETRKGFYGRLKQGLYPMPAPIGYRDEGQGQPKSVDPVRGPLIRQAFELYATGNFSLCALVEKMYELGLRTKSGRKVAKNSLSKIVHNPFYTGLIYLKTTGEMFSGRHAPIVTRALFDRVQLMLNGKSIEKHHRHFFIFRKQLRCERCGATLIGEIQKHHTYYRCQVRACPQKTIREELVEEVFGVELRKLRFSESENEYLHAEIKNSHQDNNENLAAQTKSLQIQLEHIKGRFSKLTDAYIDGALDRETYTAKKNSLLVEQQAIRERLENVGNNDAMLRQVRRILELANDAHLSYKMGLPVEKREMVKIISSNLAVQEKSVSVKLHYPFQLIAERERVVDGGPLSGVHRSLSALLSQLVEYSRTHHWVPGFESEEKKVKVGPEQLVHSALKISNQKYLFRP